MSMSPSLSDAHLSSIRFRVPFAEVWARLTDPLTFPRLYPTWTVEVERTDRSGVYAGIGPSGDSFTIVPRLSREHGVIDFEVTNSEGHIEVSRSRLFALKDGGCVLVHLAERWVGVDDAFWAQHQRGTDADLENARRLIEADSVV